MAGPATSKWMFRLRGTLTKSQTLVLGAIGIGLFLGVWVLLTSGTDPLVAKQILPSPGRVFASYSDLMSENDLLVNTFKSIGLNLSGYVLAMVFSRGMLKLFVLSH